VLLAGARGTYLCTRAKEVSMTATLPDTKMSSLPSQRFSTRHIGPQVDDREKMLATLGLTDLKQLTEQSLPRSIRSTEPLALPPALSESETLAVLRDLASRNRPLTPMIGLGYHGTSSRPPGIPPIRRTSPKSVRAGLRRCSTFRP
jgi:hypothetical protein